MTATNSTYTIKLSQFEGPFDLLLFFIERDELDIYNIPITKIADDFLEYIRHMESMNIDLASEFILVAATLMRIKAKMLIPRKPIDEEGNEVDPREELVQRLLEYKRYKSVLEEMREKEAHRSKQTFRGNISKDLKVIAKKALVDLELESLTLFKLMKTFTKVVERFEDNSRRTNVHTVVNYNYSIQGQQVYILSRIKARDKPTFEHIFGTCENRIHAIVTFLALLELLNLAKLRLIQGEGINNFWLTDEGLDEEIANAATADTVEAKESELTPEEDAALLEEAADLLDQITDEEE